MKTETPNQNVTAATAASAPKRRMRRRARTNSALSTQDSALSSRRHRAHPFQPLPEFAHLRPDQLEYIHDLLRDSTLADVQQQLHMDLGVRLSSSTLHRYRAQLDLADQLHLGTDTASAVAQLRDLYAGRETNLDPAGLQVIKQRALALAAAPKTSPSLLKDLHRIFTYEDRKQEKQQTLAHRQDIDSQKLQLARERHALELRKQQHREKIDAAKAPKNNPNANDEAAMRAEALLEYGRQLRRQREEAAASSNGGTSSMSPTFSSRDAITPFSAAPDACQTLTTEQRTN